MRVAVLGGGRSSEHPVSLNSAASVAAGLRQAGHTVTEITIARDGTWLTAGGSGGSNGPGGSGGSGGSDATLALTPGAGFPGADVVFPVLHGPYGEDGVIQGLLEALDVPYVGSGVAASAICMDKVVFKDLMAAAGVPQVDYRRVTAAEFAADPDAAIAALEPLGLPVFVKPARLGSSVGIARVASVEQFAPALADAFRFDPLAIVEAAAVGLEVEISVLGNLEPVASLPGEILLAAGESGWYDYEAKYTPGNMQLMVPARISAAATERLQALAVQTFLAAGCSGLARADFFVNGEEVLINELNTMPGFTETSVYGALWTASGIPYPELLDRLLGLALERHAAMAAHSG